MQATVDALPAGEAAVLARIKLAATARLAAVAGEADPGLGALALARPFLLGLSAPGLPPAYVLSRGGRLQAFSGGERPRGVLASLVLRFASPRSAARVLSGGRGLPLPLFLGPGGPQALRFFRAAAARLPALLSAPSTPPPLRARLLATAALAGLSEAAADPFLAARLAHVPDGSVAVEAEGAFALGLEKRGGRISMLRGAPAQPDATLSFAGAGAAVAVLSGARQAAVALGSGEVSVRGLLPLAQGLFAVLDRLGCYLEVKAGEAKA